MKEQIVLDVARRTVLGKQVRRLRREGWLPGVIYGHGTEPAPVQMNAREASRLLSQAGQASLLTLRFSEDELRSVLVRETQRDPLSQHLMHVDFYQVRMDETITVSIPVRLVGRAPAVREKEGVLVHGLSEIEIECLPGDLISEVSADLSVLRDIGDSISVADLNLPAGVAVLDDSDEMIAVITRQAAEELPEEAPVAVEVEVQERGKKVVEEEE
ncbi:MAG: 50S ribosomal protein L25 [Chloroflexi bacterium]|nr:50S ribosomal protein L25 [Chloroflexota bacterium]